MIQFDGHPTPRFLKFTAPLRISDCTRIGRVHSNYFISKLATNPRHFFFSSAFNVPISFAFAHIMGMCCLARLWPKTTAAERVHVSRYLSESCPPTPLHLIRWNPSTIYYAAMDEWYGWLCMPKRPRVERSQKNGVQRMSFRLLVFFLDIRRI